MDLKELQYFVTEDGGLQLGDFNKGRFLTKHDLPVRKFTNAE
jgi:hypothetical protein